MRPITAALVAASLFVAGCSERPAEPAAPATPAAQAEPAAAMRALFDEFFERQLELNPLAATSIGDYRYNDRLANSIGPEYREASAALDREFLERLSQIEPAGLSDNDRLSYEIFKLRREQSIEGEQFPDYLQPVNQFRSMTNYFVQVGSGTGLHPFRTVEDYDDFLGRIDDFVVYVDQAIANMREGMRTGIVEPRILMEKALPQVQSQIVESAEESGFYAPVRNMPDDFEAADRERLAAAYEEAIENKLVPAYQRLANFLGDEYIGAARDTVGLHAIPGGAEWYAYNVRVITTTDLTPDEIHRIGLDEVERIHDEMRGVMAEVGFEGGLDDFFEFMNTDEQFYFDEAGQLIQGYRDMADHVAELSKKLFEVFPKTDFEVRRIEPFREKSAAGGQYQAGTVDGTRPGIFYANAYDIKSRPIWAMESLFLHEAIPGHHFQISLQRENENLPDFRRFGGDTAYIEGWGLYAESLGKELGVYTDPYQYFGALNAELWRAIRLVVDTGIHAKGWSRQDVLDFMYANSAVRPARAIAEAERFMAIPGQALAYKIGQLRIREIRDKAEARLGDRFDVKAFHTQVLMDGPMPLSMLENKIDRWVEAQL
jgi:uncharacterized protein (DUF885 family)